MKTALVLGGAGFIGMALTQRLKADGYWVRALDIRYSPFGKSAANEFFLHDLRRGVPAWFGQTKQGEAFDEVYQLAADLGGAGYIYAGKHDAEIVTGNVLINAKVAEAFSNTFKCGKLFFASSACVYHRDSFALDDEVSEFASFCLPPDNAYGTEKLFSEKLYQTYAQCHGLNVAIARFGTIYGPGCRFDDGKEQAVAAIIRKVIDAKKGDKIEVWGNGKQSRPLVYIDDLVEGIRRLMACGALSGEPVNLASKTLTSCDDIAYAAIAFSGKKLTVRHVPGPTGALNVGMSTDLADKHLQWAPETRFEDGLERTYDWIAAQKERRKQETS